jgi:hypothetical protein
MKIESAERLLRRGGAERQYEYSIRNMGNEAKVTLRVIKRRLAHALTCRPMARSPVCTADTIIMRNAESAVDSDAAKSDNL